MVVDVDIALGMKLPKNVYQPSGNKVFLLASGKTLTKNDIEKLKRNGINEVLVREDDIRETFNEILQSKIEVAIKESNFKDLKELAKTISNIANEVSTIKFDMSKYIHEEEISPLKLSVLNTFFAVALTKRYNQIYGADHAIDLENIALAGMFQDIGLTVSDNELYFESIRLAYQDEYEFLLEQYPSLKPIYLKRYNKDVHALYSYFIIRGNHFDPLIEKAVLLHHEVYLIEDKEQKHGMLNVSLKNIKNQTAATMAMILKAVDIYNRLLFNAKKKNPKQPFKPIASALDNLVAKGTLSPDIVNILKDAIPLYREGIMVKLNDGTIAKVKQKNDKDILKPILEDLLGKDITYDDHLEILYPLSQEEIKERRSV